jgi:hypothetical protein
MTPLRYTYLYATLFFVCSRMGGELRLKETARMSTGGLLRRPGLVVQPARPPRYLRVVGHVVSFVPTPSTPVVVEPASEEEIVANPLSPLLGSAENPILID